MIRDITIGQYYPADSILHRLDPRVKISCTLLYLISLFLFKSVLGYVIAGCFLAGVIWLSKVSSIYSTSTDAHFINQFRCLIQQKSPKFFLFQIAHQRLKNIINIF